MCDLNQLQGGFVPQAHNLTNSLQRYLAYRQQGVALNNQSFVNWRIGQGAARGGAQAEMYPLGPNQCGFAALSLQEFFEITNQPEGFVAGRILRAAVPNPIQGACQTVKSAFAVGMYRRQGFNNAALLADIVARNFAGNNNAARAILNSGQSFLRHFRLVDDADVPNGRFAMLFRC